MAVPAQEPYTPLRGLRVLDLTAHIAGPTAARMLAEMGADVIKIEPPGGEDGRSASTPFLGREGINHSIGNRTKRGLAVDLHTEGGRQVVRDIARTADVFL